MYNRLLNINPEGKESCLLLGPRGTGKTHWISHHLRNALVFNLLKTATFRPYWKPESNRKPDTSWISRLDRYR